MRYAYINLLLTPTVTIDISMYSQATNEPGDNDFRVVAMRCSPFTAMHRPFLHTHHNINTSPRIADAAFGMKVYIFA